MDRFDKEIKDKLNMELKNIILSENTVKMLQEQAKREKKPSLGDALASFWNREINIPYSTCIAAAALAVFLGISAFTVTDKDIASFINRNIIEISEYWEGAD